MKKIVLVSVMPLAFFASPLFAGQPEGLSTGLYASIAAGSASHDLYRMPSNTYLGFDDKASAFRIGLGYRFNANFCLI
jgi:hypothetical protein